MGYTAREQAAVDGHMTYEGQACPHCGGRERYVSNACCVACTRERTRARDERIRELRRQAKEGVG